jgi:adenylate cyclase
MISIGRQSPSGPAVASISDTTQNAARDPAGTPQPSAVEVRAELERILASRCFEQAARSSKFLRFVVEQTLGGQGDRLKGYTIAIEVFGRSQDFDAQSDPLVRVEAGRLRRRLTEYYADEGRNDSVRIELPRGSYNVTSSYHPPAAEVLLGPMPESAPVDNEAARNRRRWRRIRSVLIAAVLLGGLAVILLQQLELSRLATGPPVAARTSVRLPGKPPIVVLPFDNLAGEPAVGALAATIREELLLLLDDPELFVVATQTGADAAGTVAAGEADAYVLSGSARATGAAIRVTARLVEPGTGRQIWSDAYDEPLAALDDPVEQRALARRIAAVAEPYGPVFESEIERLRALPAGELAVPDCVLKYYEFRRMLDRVRHADALACFAAATQREPTSAEAWAVLSILEVEQSRHGYTEAAAAPLDDAREAARRAMDIDGNNLHANSALLATQFFGGEDFRPVAERMLRTWPDNAEAQAYIGFMLVATGDTARGRSLVERAVTQTQRAPSGYHTTLALAALREGNFDEALAAALRIDSPDWAIGHIVVAAAAALAGRADLAARAKARALALDPVLIAGLADVTSRWQIEPTLAALLQRGFEEAGRL